MIHIIAGIYGYKNPYTGAVEAKTAKSAPFSCSNEEESRLVSLGVAEYCDIVQDDEQAGNDGTSQEHEKDLEEMTKKELTALAESIGIKVPKRATNPDIITLIKDAQAEHDDYDAEDQDDDGDAPALSAAMPE
ncbi:MAG: Rho termination factor N-terminal domain-containing protein [Blautia sp.]|nr:Rho termination factor N-terminal domain-containing protein [Blautia sp.]